MAKTLKALSDDMASVVEATTPSIVRVEARRRLPATGIIWSSDGMIVTANHIVERDEDIRVVTSDGTTHDATLVGRDGQNDLAVLKVAAEIDPATFGENEALKIGNLVLALGRPGGQTQATLGVVSALVGSGERTERRMRRKKGRSRRGRRGVMPRLVDGYIQTDVVMYPGFSGGPLVSGDGAVHGVNTSGFGRGASITVPVSTIRNTVATLQAHGKMRQGYLGVGVQPVRLPENISSELDQETGLLIVSIEGESPAATANLLVGDIIVGMDDESIEQLDELMSLLTGERVGTSIPMQLVRGGALQTMAVSVGERG